MANEGSTKPTYSELAKMLDADRASLARVRGLLQRIGEIANSDLAWNRRVNTIVELLGAESADIGKLDAADKKEFLYNPPRAKSAEMGKVNRVDGVIGQVYGFDCEETSGCPGTGDPPDQTVPLGCVRAREHLHGEAHDCEPGSAETGGEKAAEDLRFDLAEQELNAAWNEPGNSPAMCNVIEAALIVIAEVRSRFATFPRHSQNQTVSSGVEGAHEGTTADKSGSREPEKFIVDVRPRKPGETAEHLRKVTREVVPAEGYLNDPDTDYDEPEKLNNACPFCKQTYRLVGLSTVCGCMAESSLSSPPHLDDE